MDSISKASTKTKTVPVLKLRSADYKHPDLSKVSTNIGGDISSTFSSLEGNSINQSLPENFTELKKRILKNPEAVQASWLRLKKVLAQKIEEVHSKGPEVVPAVDLKDLDGLNESERAGLLEKGCFVIRNVFPRSEAEKLKSDAEEYVKRNPQTKGFPKDNKIVFELYWSKSQIRARSDPRMMKALKFANNLWHATENSEVVLDQNVSYADRFRIRKPGDSLFSLGPHVDGGGIERWEDEEYRNCYTPIWEGKWEEYDPYDATHRANANMSLYPTAGACSVFRTFQGWLALSDIAPSEGTILFAPYIKEITSYVLLRPFFNENDELDLSPRFPGTVPGKCQEFNDASHPHLELSKLMTHAPKVSPGDAVFWHCDMIHAVDPVHKGEGDSSVMYIPSVPLCELNTRYLQLQRESFLNSLPGPDFPGFPNGEGETTHIYRGDINDVIGTGGREAAQEFCLEPFDIKDKYSETFKKTVQACNDILFY